MSVAAVKRITINRKNVHTTIKRTVGLQIVNIYCRLVLYKQRIPSEEVVPHFPLDDFLIGSLHEVPQGGDREDGDDGDQEGEKRLVRLLDDHYRRALALGDVHPVPAVLSERVASVADGEAALVSNAQAHRPDGPEHGGVGSVDGEHTLQVAAVAFRILPPKGDALVGCDLQARLVVHQGLDVAFPREELHVLEAGAPHLDYRRLMTKRVSDDSSSVDNTKIVDTFLHIYFALEISLSPVVYKNKNNLYCIIYW